MPGFPWHATFEGYHRPKKNLDIHPCTFFYKKDLLFSVYSGQVQKGPKTQQVALALLPTLNLTWQGLSDLGDGTLRGFLGRLGTEVGGVKLVATMVRPRP